MIVSLWACKFLENESDPDYYVISMVAGYCSFISTADPGIIVDSFTVAFDKGCKLVGQTRVLVSRDIRMPQNFGTSTITEGSSFVIMVRSIMVAAFAEGQMEQRSSYRLGWAGMRVLACSSGCLLPESC